MKKILDIIIGYSGSTEDPSKMSLRMSAIIFGVISKLAVVGALGGFVLPYTDAQVQGTIGTLTLVGATFVWLFGLIRAIVNALKNR